MLDESLLAAAFQRIGATRMAGIDLLNPALSVEAVGFRDWNGQRVGVLITPWCVNLVILREAGDPLPSLALDQRRRWVFPSGAYEFMGGEEPECGPFDFLSLFSPPEEFCDQTVARACAESVMSQLFEASEAAGSGESSAHRLTRRDLFVPAERSG